MKLSYEEYERTKTEVTLRVRVWIETRISREMARSLPCHPPREGVD